MGLGPSIKMTTLHHYRCPVTAELAKAEDLEYTGIIVDGVSEVCDDKIYTAKRVGDLAQIMRADGAIVAIGNAPTALFEVIRGTQLYRAAGETCVYK